VSAEGELFSWYVVPLCVFAGAFVLSMPILAVLLDRREKRKRGGP
jgi:hypothetical protein